MSYDSRIAEWLSRCGRSHEDRIVGGVCVGLGECFAVDTTLVRLAFLLLALASGVGILLYALLWLILPAEDAQALSIVGRVRENVGQLRREAPSIGARLGELWSGSGRSAGVSPWPRPVTRRWLGIGAVVAGIIVLLQSLGLFGWLSPVRVLGLVLVIGGAAAIAGFRPRQRG